MRFASLLSLSLFLSLACAADECEAKLARVAVPVADLRAEPAPASDQLEHDPLEESQLLYGEEVEILEELDDWARVIAVEQREWTHNNQWEGYPGWVELRTLAPYRFDWTPNLMVTSKFGRVRAAPASDAPVRILLSFGSQLVGAEQIGARHRSDFLKAGPVSDTWWRIKLLDGNAGWIRFDEVTPFPLILEWRSNPAIVRARLIKMARLFVGDPYYWGGRSAHNPRMKGPPHWGSDCSGLVGLLYQANGFQIPRDAHEIWMQARPIAQEELIPGDLVFLSKLENPDRIGHIMLYTGEGKVIEAPRTGVLVREIPLEERLKEAEGRRVHCGAYLPPTS